LQDKISSSGGRPTLKDYLDMMKANKGIPTSATTGSIQGDLKMVGTLIENKMFYNAYLQA